MPDLTINLYTDGACRGNPGQGGAGAVLIDEEGNVFATRKTSLGLCTNNIAEYKALILGLEEALKRKCRRLNIFLDSELLVNQINGQYKVKNENLKIMMRDVRKLLSYLDSFTVSHIDRSQNRLADKLANEAIDEAVK
ncbi:MAG TPA: ribonuclease H [Syntrophaceae bacterium]|jgi:ribonuclease HI/probable phosphoglycerate mutase|nr:ribonuclease H [Syntrophaceae bacterium]